MTKKPEAWTVLSMLEWATGYFSEKGIPDPRHSIEWLLAETLDIKRLDLYLKYDRPLSPSELDDLRPLVRRRAEHEPLQYIVGYTDFMNARIEVTPDVLIPRIETEQLVEIILDRHSGDEEKNVIDIGTGSGCIPVALKMERPAWQVHGLDVSDPALELARRNAETNETEIHFFRGDITDRSSFDWESGVDIVVSNPPYILPDEKNSLEPQVHRFEPHRALFCENMDKMYGSIIDFARTHLAGGGELFLEVHELHADEILGFFDAGSWDVRLLKDYNRKPRFIVAGKL